MKVQSQIIELEKHRTDTEPRIFNLTISGNGTYEECRLMQDLMLDITDKSKDLIEAFKDIWLNAKIYLTKKELKLIIDANRNNFELLDPEFIKVVDDNFQDMLL